ESAYSSQCVRSLRLHLKPQTEWDHNAITRISKTVSAILPKLMNVVEFDLLGAWDDQDQRLKQSVLAAVCRPTTSALSFRFCTFQNCEDFLSFVSGSPGLKSLTAHSVFISDSKIHNTPRHLTDDLLTTIFQRRALVGSPKVCLETFRLH